MSVVRGIASGAAGTAALNVVTYLDMAVRGRGASQVPAQDVQKLADLAGIELGSEGPESDQAKNRRTALGSLLGYVTGLTVGALYGGIRSRTHRRASLPVASVALGITAMAGSDVPSTALGVTDPREWGAKGWASDIVPHLAYGVVTALTFEALQDRL